MTDVLYKPSAWGQRFHNLTHNEALGAGSAGPGKTAVLIAEPFEQIRTEHLRCQDRNHPHHQKWGQSKGWALFLRRTFPMLRQTIARAVYMFKQMDPGGRWSEEEHTFIWSSGYRYQFGHCNDPDDWEQYFGIEFCAAGGTRVRMADGMLKPIEEIAVGDEVQTLEGARRVTATHETGRKPCVQVVVRDQRGNVGTQIHPTTHPVLVCTTDESPSESSPHKDQTEGRARRPSYVWQDYESLLCGRPQSEVRRVSSVVEGIGFVRSDGSRLATEQLPSLIVRLALHEPESLPGDSTARQPTESRWRREGTSGPASKPQGLGRLQGKKLARQLQAAEGELPALGCSAETSVCDGAGEPTCSGRPIGSTGRCSSSPRSHGERTLGESETCQEHAQPRDDAGRPGQTASTTDGQAQTPQDIPCNEWSYPHFYSGLERARTEAVRTGTGEVTFAGWHQTYDLTVEGANHYITESGIVNAQTIIMFDELVQFLEEQYDNIKSRLRTSDSVLGAMLKCRSMSNPVLKRQKGGEDFMVNDPQWVRRRFVDAAPEGNVTLKKRIVMNDGSVVWRTRIYLPATLYDNPDPAFVKRYEEELQDQKPHIRAALLFGDWYVSPGSYYADYWNPRLHVCKPFAIPHDWRMFRSMDWGFKKHGVVVWWAVDGDDSLHAVYEYTFRGKMDVEVAEQMVRIERSLGTWRNGRSALTGPADTQLWEQRGENVKSKAQTFAEKGFNWVPAIKKEGSRRSAAQLLVKRLKDHDEGTTTPGIVFFSRCRECVRTIPAIQEDPKDSENPLDGGEDHHHDTVLYACSFASQGLSGLTPLDEMPDDEWPADEDAGPEERGYDGYGSQV